MAAASLGESGCGEEGENGNGKRGDQRAGGGGRAGAEGDVPLLAAAARTAACVRLRKKQEKGSGGPLLGWASNVRRRLAASRAPG